MAVIVAIFMGMSVSAEEIFKDRSLLKRGRFLKLSHSGYIWSKIIYLTGLSLVQTLLFILAGERNHGDSRHVGHLVDHSLCRSIGGKLAGLVLSRSLSSIICHLRLLFRCC